MDVPSFSDLPIRPDLPPRSAWEVFGPDDERGTINFLTAQHRAAAAALVRTGRVFALSWDLDQPSPPLFGRKASRHRIIDLDPVGTEDAYDDFYPQASSQWDALAHIRHPKHGFYNGRTRQDITGRSGSRIGIDNWAREGIAGRFVLADIHRWRAALGRPMRPGENDPVSVRDISDCLRWQDVTLTGGDILLLRFGWISWYEAADARTRAEIASTDFFNAAGLANELATAEWLWDNKIAAVAADNPALEVMPFDESGECGYLHYRLIPLLGMAVGELFYLDDLAAYCADEQRYEGLFTAAPLNKTGGCGSPANAIALM